MVKETIATSIIRLSWSPNAECIVNNTRNPQDMWNVPETSLDIARSYIGRQVNIQQLHSDQSNRDTPRAVYFTDSSYFCIELDNPDNAIAYCGCGKPILTSLWWQYVITLLILLSRWPLPTREDTLRNFKGRSNRTQSHESAWRCGHLGWDVLLSWHLLEKRMGTWRMW